VSYVKVEDIYKATNGGLDIILQYFPQANNSVADSRRKFKLRNVEKTASATLKRLSDGNWVVTDFGGDGKPKNAIAIVQEEENCDFKTAIQLIAERFNILAEEVRTEIQKPDFKQRDAEQEEIDGTWYFQVKDFTEKELKSIFSEKVWQYAETLKNTTAVEYLSSLCRKYFFYSLESYTIIKDRRATVISSNEHYPIMMFEVTTATGKKIKKIYQPLSLDKGKRFMYYGGRPDDHIFGLSQCVKKYNDLNAGMDEEYLSDDEESKAEERKEKKIDEIILCTGGSDALNVAALGYEVVWLNSESAKLNGDNFKSISRICHKFCNLPDIDATGRRTAHELNMIYLDVCIINLPPSLADRRDWRGNPCKDVRDYFKYYGAKAFADLVKSALPYKFWHQKPRYKDKKITGYDYDVNNACLYWFLAQNGYFQFRTGGGENSIYISIVGNTVKEITPKDIKNFVNDFLQARNEDVNLRNTFYRTTQLNSTSFENLPFIKIDFTDFTKESQFMFFQNQTWEINKNTIIDHRPGDVQRYVWEEEVIPHRVKLLEDFFTITHDKVNDEYSIEIKNTQCLFFQYVINTTRMYWKIEEKGIEDTTENGEKFIRKDLNEKEIKEQQMHLINRIYTIGYLIMRYKDPSRPWAVWAMENKVVEESVSDGGSGKSITMKFPRFFMKSETLSARDPRMTENKHLLENITEHVDYVLSDDCHEYMNFSYFYPMITGEWHINPKNTRSFTLSFAQGPKLGFSSNYAPKNADPSTERRLLYTVFSDYYHHGPSDEHAEARTPKDDFGKNLFDDFTEEEWNLALNFGAQCVKTYLNYEKIVPPMTNVTQRQLLGEMGDAFKPWADVYFSEISGRLDEMILKEEAQNDCIQKNNLKGWSSQKFGKSLKAWCKFQGYKLNPKELRNKDGRIIRKHKYKDMGVDKETTKEMIYIQTKAEINDTTDLPF
jgi:hypothetical protein